MTKAETHRTLFAGALSALLLSTVSTAALAEAAPGRDAPIRTAPTTPAAGPADEHDARIAALNAQVEALRAQIATLAEQIGDLKVSTAANIKDVRAAQAVTTVSIAAGKPTIASGDGAFSATLHGVMQLDAANYYQDDHPPPSVTARDLNSGTNFRRARIGIDGKVFGDWDYNLLFDFGGSGAEDAGRIHELWVQYSGFKPLKVRVGAFPPSLGLEDAASTNGQLFLERPSIAEIARVLAGGDTRVGAQLFGYGDRWFAAAAVTGNTISTLNTQATSFTAPTFDEQLGFTARVAGTPLRGYDWLVHVGVNASYVATPADLGSAAAVRYALQLRDRPELRVDGTRLIDTGQIDTKSARHWGLELAAQKQNFYAEAEYFDIALDRRNAAAGVSNPQFSGWYVEGGWVLTGEARKYNTATAAFDAPSVTNVFDPRKRHWGAVELAARYSTADLNYHGDAALAADRVRGGQQDIWSVGVNWFPNSAVKFMLEYLDVSIDRKNSAGLTLGQDYQAIAARSQVAF